MTQLLLKIRLQKVVLCFCRLDCTKYFFLPVSSNRFSNHPEQFISIHVTARDSPSRLRHGLFGTSLSRNY